MAKRRSLDERAVLEVLLGEPLMVDDPLITVTQAAAVLDVSPTEVRALIHTGDLVMESGPSTRRCLRLSAVTDQPVAVGRIRRRAPARVGIAEAAGILDASIHAVHRLVNDGLLVRDGGRYPFRRGEVESLAHRRRNWITVAQAARYLRCTPWVVRALLDQGMLTLTGDSTRPVDRDQLDVVARHLGKRIRA